MDKKELKNLYNNNLILIKQDLKKTLADMALDLDIPQNTISAYIRGERTISLEFATQLCKTYGINLNWFAAGEGEMYKKALSSDYTRKDIENIVKDVLKRNNVC